MQRVGRLRLLPLAVLAVFGQTANYGFVNFDNDVYVYQNRHVQAGLSAEGIAWAFTDRLVASHWHPLTWLSLMADAQISRWGGGPLEPARLAARMHMVNVVLHATNAAILFLVLLEMTARTWPSALVAALFAVHPLHVESVAWITERKDVLSGLFFLLTLAAYVGYARRPFSLLRYLLVAALFALGLMAKPMLVTLPFVLLLLDYWPLGRWEKGRKGEREMGGKAGHPRSGSGEKGSISLSPFPPCSLSLLLVEKIPLLLLSAGSATVTFLAAQRAVVSLASAPISARIARAAILYVTYLGKTLWPVNLAVMSPGGAVESTWPALGAGVLLVSITVGVVWGAWRGERWLAAGWFWYLGMLLPVISLVQVGVQVMADRFLYLPQIGICVALVWGVRVTASRRALAAVAALVMAALIVCAWQQTRYWRNGGTLWTRALACSAQNPLAHNSLGAVLTDQGQFDEAVAHFRKALKIKPDYAQARYNLEVVLAERGSPDEIIRHLHKALEIKPADAKARYNLGLVLAEHGRADEAVAHFQKALDLAIAGSDAALADAIRAQIRRHRQVAPAGNSQ